MADEKISTRVSLSLTEELKKNAEDRAKQIGVPLTQYIVTLIIEDIKRQKDSQR